MFVVNDINLYNNNEMKHKFHFSLEAATIDLNSRNRNKIIDSVIKEVEWNQLLFSSSVGTKDSLFKINIAEDCESIFQLYKNLQISLLTRQEECLQSYYNYEKNCLKASDGFSTFQINTDGFNQLKSNEMVLVYIDSASRIKSILEEIEELEGQGFEEKLSFLQERLFIEVVKIV